MSCGICFQVYFQVIILLSTTSLHRIRTPRVLTCLLLISLLVFTTSAAGEDKGDENSKGRLGSGQAETFLLDVTINTLLLPEIVRAEKLADGRLALPLDAWQAARLRLPDGDPLSLPDNQQGYALESVPGLTYELDRGRLTLTITASAAAFEGSAIDQGRGGASPPNLSPLGFYLDYDASATGGDGGVDSYGTLVEGVAFNRWGSTVAGMVLRGDKEDNEAIRTETFWRRDLPGPMETLVLGDTIGIGGAWSRPARYAGIRWARDFSLRPGFITMPMPSLSGSAALPSTVEVLINNQRQLSEQVKPGPFELTNVPVTSGAGQINLIVRDLLGRETIVAQSYYLSPRLLAAGLSDYSLEAGALRENFGSESSDYGDGFGAGTYRYGLTSALTGEARIELQEVRQAAGIDLVGLLGTLAAAQVSAAVANADGVQGNHYLLGLERSTRVGGGSLRWEYFDRNFSQFASVPEETRPRRRYSANLGISLFENVSAGITYTQQEDWEGDRFSLAAANLGVSLPWDMHLNTNASQQLDGDQDWSCGISLSLPLGKQRTANARTNRGSDGRTTNTAEVSQSPPAGPGLGWRLRASDDLNQLWQGDLTWNTNVGRFSAEASDTADDPALRLGAGGSVGLLGGYPFATRRIGSGSFAVIKVGDLEVVPVYRSNQLVATTNSSGLALVPGLLPYQENQLTIDPVELPFDIELLGVRKTALPYARSGLFIEFPVRRSRNALVLLRQADGSVVPAGARVTVSPGENEFLVGKRGEVYLMDLVDSNRLSVLWKGGSCQIDLPLDPKGPSEPRIGPLTCGGQP
jgi:outer membrane usher protein